MALERKFNKVTEKANEQEAQLEDVSANLTSLQERYDHTTTQFDQL